jgi:hypothetical protein
MRTVVFCHAPLDAEFVREIGKYLEANLAINCCYDEGVVHHPAEFLEVVGRALSAELTVALLSPESIPQQWRREAWEPALLEQPKQLGNLLVFALARECRFPALLRREAFCDFTGDQTSGLRSLKRLIFRHTSLGTQLIDVPALGPVGEEAAPIVEELRDSVADRPGVVLGMSRDAALAFAHACAQDFEGACWIDCARRSSVGILGEMVNRLGLRLSGSFEQNRRAFEMFCTERRCLFVLEHAEAEQVSAVAPGGLASVVATAATPLPEAMALQQVVLLFDRWMHEERRCSEALGDALFYLRTAESWPVTQRLGAGVLSFLKNGDRLAEANEVLELLLAGARANQDQDAQHHYEWDRSWILGHWGEPYVETTMILHAPGELRQLGLFDA